MKISEHTAPSSSTYPYILQLRAYLVELNLKNGYITLEIRSPKDLTDYGKEI
jgi:hypothetical protein